MDNATNNDTMMRALKDEDDIPEDFDPEDSRVRCLAHILHLAARAGLEQLRLPDVNKDVEDVVDGNTLNKVSEFDSVCRSNTL